MSKYKEFKLFTLTEYEDEEKYLRNKHKQGYELESIFLPGIYTFKKCMPKDVVYRLDYHPNKDQDKTSYIQMFQDYGWEYIQDLNGYSYFRKEADDNHVEENEIFCDDESRMEMLKNVIVYKMIPILVLFLCCFLPSLCNYGFSEPSPSGIRIALWIFVLMIILLYIYLIIRIVIGYFKLIKKYDKSKK